MKGVILVTPYDSLTAVAATHYGYFPVRWLLKHNFSSDQYARTIQAPALIVAAEDDVIVPPSHAEKLYAVWAGPKQIVVLDKVGHNDIDQHERYYSLLNEFLGRLNKT